MDFPRFCGVVVKHDCIRCSSINESHQDSALVVKATDGVIPSLTVAEAWRGKWRAFLRRLLKRRELFWLPTLDTIRTLIAQNEAHSNP